jgi:sugar phosphate isomerase/epimerase
MPRLCAAEQPLYQIGLSQYSLHRMIGSGQLDPLDYPDFAKRTFDLSGIDVWQGAFPTDDAAQTDRFTKSMRRRADDAGCQIFLLMVKPVDATAADQAKRRAQLEPVYPWLDRAAVLGCDYVRVFLRAGGENEAVALNRAVDSLVVLADAAKDRELTMVIEPGASKLSQRGDFLAKVASTAAHSHLGLMPDFGKFGPHDLYEGTEAMMPWTKVVSAKSHAFDEQGNESRYDYGRLMKIIVDSGFNGIVAIEYEGQELSEVKGVKATQRLLMKHRRRLRDSK